MFKYPKVSLKPVVFITPDNIPPENAFFEPFALFGPFVPPFPFFEPFDPFFALFGPFVPPLPFLDFLALAVGANVPVVVTLSIIKVGNEEGAADTDSDKDNDSDPDTDPDTDPDPVVVPVTVPVIVPVCADMFSAKRNKVQTTVIILNILFIFC